MASWSVQAQACCISAKNKPAKKFRCGPQCNINMHFPRQDPSRKQDMEPIPCDVVSVGIAQARQARAFAAGGPIPASYWRLGRRWAIWGAIATLVPLCNLYSSRKQRLCTIDRAAKTASRLAADYLSRAARHVRIGDAKAMMIHRLFALLARHVPAADDAALSAPGIRRRFGGRGRCRAESHRGAEHDKRKGCLDDVFG
jgi:hypothetical protein